MNGVCSDVTRGKGLLEGFLAGMRTTKANALIPSRLREGRILDIGCGPRPFFLLNTPFSEKYGLDKEVAGDQFEDSEGRSIVTRCTDIEREGSIPFETEYFDVVTMLAVFEHITPDRLAPMVNEICRVLKPGGFYIITTPSAWTGRLLGVLAGLGLVSKVEIEDHKDQYTPRKVRMVLESGGFRMENIRTGRFEAGMNIWATASK
jgi:SAM-dependent methyltransferase